MHNQQVHILSLSEGDEGEKNIISNDSKIFITNIFANVALSTIILLQLKLLLYTPIIINTLNSNNLKI